MGPLASVDWHDVCVFGLQVRKTSPPATFELTPLVTGSTSVVAICTASRKFRLPWLPSVPLFGLGSSEIAVAFGPVRSMAKVNVLSGVFALFQRGCGCSPHAP